MEQRILHRNAGVRSALKNDWVYLLIPVPNCYYRRLLVIVLLFLGEYIREIKSKNEYYLIKILHPSSAMYKKANTSLLFTVFHFESVYAVC